MRSQRFIGDIALFYLPYVEEAIALEPDRLRSYRLPIMGGLCPQPGQPKPIRGSGLVEVIYATAGFLLVRYPVYLDMMRRLGVPLCNEHLGRPLIPFFRPLIRPQEDGTWYLSPEFLFCESARRCGYRVVVDPAVRLLRVGTLEYGWEEG